MHIGQKSHLQSGTLLKNIWEALEECKNVLRQLSDSKYSEKVDALSNASIGEHVRHFIEFYRCLISQSLSGRINYGLRKRDKAVQNDPIEAIKAIEEIQSAIAGLNLNDPLDLIDHSNGSLKIQTNMGRELQYNFEHTIHHLAIVGIGLKLIAPNIRISSYFGVAPSTIAHLSATTESPTDNS